MNSTTRPETTGADALQAAIALHLSGQLEQAEGCYREALRLQPQQSDASHNLGLLLRDTGRPEQALPLLESACSLHPDNVQYLISYSGTLLNQNDASRTAQAAQLLDAALARGMDGAAIRCNRGNAARALQLPDEAERHFRAALAQQPGDALVNYNLASLMQERGNLEEAAARYRAALTSAPHFIEAQNGLAVVFNDLGITLMTSNRIDDAAAHFRAAVMLRPDFAEALSNLANANFLRKEFGEAEAACRKALTVDAGLYQAHLNLGNALQATRRHAEAEASYRNALQSRPDAAEAHYNLGNLLQILERLPEAVSHYQRALELNPNLAEAHNSLGNALRSQGQTDAAIACYRRALELASDYAAIYSNLALALQPSAPEEAEACCRKALALAPDLPEALVFLADLQANRGRFAEAEQLLQRAIKASPELPSAWAGLATLRTMTMDDHAWLEQVLKLTAQPIPMRQETHLQFAIGKYLDDVGDYDDAFAHYQRANELCKLYTPRYDAPQEDALTQRLCRDISGDFIAAQRGAASDKPIFIVGMPRSGTSLLEQILAAHPQVFGAGELPFWTQAAPHTLEQIGDATAIGLRGQAERYLALQDGMANDAVHVVDKMPGNFRYLGLIHAALPDARFIHLRRNPVDTCLSIYFQYFNEAHPYANDLGDLEHYYRLYRRVMAHWHSVVPRDRLFELAYEDLVDDPEHWGKAVFDFMGLQWDARYLDFQSNARAIGTASNWQARQKIGRRSVERWRRYTAHATPLLPLLEGAS